MATKLHEVIINVLNRKGKPLAIKEIAETIRKEKLWKRLVDGEIPPVSQISARINQYPKFFKLDKGLVSLLRNAKNEIRISRLTFNTNGWEYPSGWEGKSKSRASYEADKGFGHEEWLLDFSKIIDGYHYAYLEPINKFLSKYIGEVFDIYLYSVDGRINKNVWIGKLKNCEIINIQEAERIKGVYIQKGWLAEMKQDISNIGADRNVLSRGNGHSLFNIRFKPEDFERYLPDAYVAEDDYSISSYYYVLLKPSVQPKIEIQDTPPFILGEYVPGKRRKRSTAKRKYEEKYIEHPYLHDDISRALEEILNKEFDNVYPEHKTGFGTSIDLVSVKGKKVNFYEIKTYNDPLICIRMAIGQLLEYSYYPDRCLANEIFIVTPHRLTDLKTEKFIKNLRTNLGLPLRYIWFDLKNRRIGQIL
jgi:hypothetical protein